jgi:ferredoxin
VDHPFQVVVASTGESFEVPVGETILDVLRDHGYEVDSSCEQGICGTCVVGVLEGEPDHRDRVLTPRAQREGQLITVCISRCRGTKLVLDL